MKLSRTFTALAATSALTLAACSNAQETADEVADNATEQASRAVESATNAAGSAADNAKDAASDAADAAADQKYPDILSAELSGPNSVEYDIAVTVSSPYDSPDRYADGWRVLDEDGFPTITPTSSLLPARVALSSSPRASPRSPSKATTKNTVTAARPSPSMCRARFPARSTAARALVLPQISHIPRRGLRGLA